MKNPNTEPISYEDIRSKIKTGDFIGERTTGLTAWLIRTWTQSEINHIGMALVEKNRGHTRVSIIESTGGSGVGERALSTLSSFWWTPVKLTNSQRVKLDATHFQLKGNVLYSDRGILIQILKKLPFLRKIVNPSWLETDRAICSRYVALHMSRFFDSVPAMPNPSEMERWLLLSALDRERSLGPVYVTCPPKEPMVW